MEGAVQHRNVDAQRVSPFTMAYYSTPTITLISDNRDWSRRLMVWTEDTLFVAREKTLVESIPLHEILIGNLKLLFRKCSQRSLFL